MLDRALDVAHTAAVDVPPPPVEVRPSGPAIPILATPRKGANRRVALVLLGCLILAAAGLAFVIHRHSSCVDWASVSQHVNAALAAEERGDTSTVFFEMSQAAYGAGNDSEVNSHLASANGYLSVGETQKATQELMAAQAAMENSALPQC